MSNIRHSVRQTNLLGLLAVLDLPNCRSQAGNRHSIKIQLQVKSLLTHVLATVYSVRDNVMPFIFAA